MSEYQETALNFAKSQDDLEFSLGDTLDIKSSILLVVITFLAAQSSGFISKNPALASYWHCVQIIAVLLLVTAGVLILIELLPRRYAARMAPDAFLDWIAQLERFYENEPDRASKILDLIYKAETEKVRVRFARNSHTNALKSRLVEWAFRCALVALMLNLATLFGLYLSY